MFQLSKEEWTSLRSHFATINGRGRHPKYLPYAFTEHGVIMAAAILKSEIADKASVMIVKAFVAMRRFCVQRAEAVGRKDIGTRIHVCTVNAQNSRRVRFRSSLSSPAAPAPESAFPSPRPGGEIRSLSLRQNSSGNHFKTHKISTF